MTITKEQAFKCTCVHAPGCAFNATADKRHQFSVKVWRKNGEVKEWKRQPTKFRMPVKYGMYSYDYVDETTDCHLPEDCQARKDYNEYLIIREMMKTNE